MCLVWCGVSVLCVCACWYVLICDVVFCHCCRRCVVGCVSVGVDAAAFVVKNDIMRWLLCGEKIESPLL